MFPTVELRRVSAMLLACVVRYKYDWKLSEAAKNIMRTHTTGVSARMLYQLAQEVSVCLLFALLYSVYLKE